MFRGDSIDKRVQVLIETGNSATDVAQLRQEVANLEANLKSQVLASRAAGKSLSDIAVEARQPIERITELTAVLQRYDQVVQGGLIVNGAAASRAVLELSRGFEDFATGGALGALNNVPGAVYNIGRALGVSNESITKLTAGASGLATVAFLVYTHWDKINAAMGTGKILSEAAEMEELGKKTEKSADELERLLIYKQRQSEMESQRSGLTQDQQDQQKHVHRAIIEADDKAVVKGLVQAAPTLVSDADKEITGIEAEAQARREALRTKLVGGGGMFHGHVEAKSPEEYAADLAKDSKLREIEGRLNSRLDAGARAIMANAALDPKKLDQLIGIVKANPGAFPKGLLDKLEASTPAAREDAWQEKMAKDTDDHHDKLRAKAEKEKAATDKARVDNDERVRQGVEQAEHGKLFGDLRKRIGDAAEDTEAPVAGRQAAIDKALADSKTAKTPSGVTLSPADLKLIEEAASDAGRRLRGEAAREAKAGDAELNKGLKAGEKAVHKDQAAQDKEALAIAPGYRDRIERALLANQALIAQGAPVARTAREFQAMQARGLDPAVEPGLKRRAIEGEVGQQLHAGGQDPRLADELVRDAQADLNKHLATAFGQNVGTMGKVAATNAGMIQTMGALTDRLAQIDQANQQSQVHIRNIWGHLRRGAQQSPSLLRQGQ